MRALLGAAAFMAALAGAASAEPVKLDEARLGTVAAGFAFGPGPIDIDIGVSNAIFTPTTIANDLDFTSQIGNAFAINTNAVIAAFASNVGGYGTATGTASFNAAVPPTP